jgi:hypothetical protein
MQVHSVSGMMTMTDENRSLKKETVVADYKLLSQHRLEGMRKTRPVLNSVHIHHVVRQIKRPERADGRTLSSCKVFPAC